LKIEAILEEWMKSLRSILVFSLMCVSALLAARADSLSISLASPFQTGLGGEVLTFDATVTNTSAGTAFLNGDSFYVDSPLAVDDKPFYSTPLSLDPGDSYAGPLFYVDIPAGAPEGLYTGYFDIVGGGDGIQQNLVGETDFNVQVTPEPSSVLLMASGVAALGLVLRRRPAL
jgi:hypothetical protein